MDTGPYTPHAIHNVRVKADLVKNFFNILKAEQDSVTITKEWTSAL